MAKQTKAAAKRSLRAILQKARNLFSNGYLNTKDMSIIESLVSRNHNRLK